MGTVCGDIIGLPYERPAEKRTKDYNFEAFAKRSRFSDDTVLPVYTVLAALRARAS